MPKADNIEKDKRVRMVMNWILDGHFSNDIISSCNKLWGIDERMAYKYIKEARKTIQKVTESEVTLRLAQHIAQRMKMFTNIDGMNKDGKLSPSAMRVKLDILRDIAHLEGFYKDKGSDTPGEQIHSQVIEATLILK